MRRFTFVLTLFLVPAALHANVLITEIMYDVPGSDIGHEWVEIQTDTETNLLDWKFFEAETNHKLVLIQGTTTLASGEFAIIADNADKFLLDNPSFAGTLFDSTFSLSNTGETIAMKNNLGEVVDSVSYMSSWGARGDGNSLQSSTSLWDHGLPTLGTPFVKKEKIPVPTKVMDTPQTSPQISLQEGDTGKEVIEVDEDTSIAAGKKSEGSVREDEPRNTETGKNDTLTWWGALAFIATLSAGSVMWVQKREKKKVDEGGTLSADDFTITDISEKE